MEMNFSKKPKTRKDEFFYPNIKVDAKGEPVPKSEWGDAMTLADFVVSYMDAHSAVEGKAMKASTRYKLGRMANKLADSKTKKINFGSTEAELIKEATSAFCRTNGLLVAIFNIVDPPEKESKQKEKTAE